jgi:hypothetical protein
VIYRFLFSLSELVLKSNAHHLFWVELLTEVESLCDAADVLVDFVHALAGHREERLLSAQALIRAAIEHGVHRGVAIEPTMA